MRRKRITNMLGSLVGPITMIVLLTMPIGPLAGGLGILQPIGGIFDIGFGLNGPVEETISMQGLED